MTAAEPIPQPHKRLTRSPDDRMLAGVCSAVTASIASSVAAVVILDAGTVG